MGSHPIKHWASQQGVVALSSGEAEYYAIVKAVSQSIGIKSLLKDMHQEARIRIRVKTDATAAQGISMRTGLGKLRHIDTNQLWVQDKVRKGEVEIVKVPTWENLADTLTKYVNNETIGKHMIGTAARFEEGRHELMPEFDAEENTEAWRDEGDEEEQQHSSGQQHGSEEEEDQCVFWIC